MIKVYNATYGKLGGPTIIASEADGFLREDEVASVSEKAMKGTAKSHATA